jgi:hypothetical protein
VELVATLPQSDQWDQWKNPAFIHRWQVAREQEIEDRRWKQRVCDQIFTPSPRDISLAAVQGEQESLTVRADRLEPGAYLSGSDPEKQKHHVPTLLAHDGSWIIHPIAQKAESGKLIKAKRMYLDGLEKKAQRELSCGLLGGIALCSSGHKFYVHYECGNRYCVRCGPRQANRLFGHHHLKLFFVSQCLLLCGQENCSECDQAIAEKRLPHWPPPKGTRPRIVCAKIDFTLRHQRDSKELPAPERMRELNRLIKKFCRALEKRFGISRKEYGLAYCDELGGNNSNPHAHGLYVGPWLPQKKKELSALWYEITGDSFVLSIKYAENFSKALFHAVKYPAKFAERSTPERLADLEKVFHRVRRFHTLARFYAPEAPAEDVPPIKRCPICDSPLGEPRGWFVISDLQRSGLQDLEKVAAQMLRDRGLNSPDRAPP